MSTKKRTQTGIEYETGSGNIFADLELPNADEKHTRAMLAVQIFQILEKRNIKKQKDVAELLGIDKSEASKLMNAEFTRFSQERLIEFLNKLDYKVTLHISPMQKGDQSLEVVLM